MMRGMISKTMLAAMVVGVACIGYAQNHPLTPEQQAQIHGKSTPSSQQQQLPPAQVQTVQVTGKGVVRVNGTVLTDRDLLREMMNVFPYSRQHGGKFPKEMQEAIRNQAMKEIVFEELAYQHAVKLGMTVPPVKLKEAMGQFKTQFPSDVEYQKYLKAEMNGDASKLQEKIRRAILIDRVLNQEIAAKSNVTEAEMRAFYKKYPERFRRPESVALQTISLVIPDKATPQQKEQVRKRAEDALKQAKAAKNYEEFGMLAEKVSEDNWRVMMGDHKVVHRGAMPPQVEKVVFGMKAGEVTGIIETENSYCIARVNTVEPARQVAFAEAQAQLKKDMQKDKADDLKKSLEARLRQHAKIETLS